jgi:hypothetical protein
MYCWKNNEEFEKMLEYWENLEYIDQIKAESISAKNNEVKSILESFFAEAKKRGFKGINFPSQDHGTIKIEFITD